jgi:two-component system cell cycle sensor histidine kinase/response regulator CckA
VVEPSPAPPCGHLRLDEAGRILRCNAWLAEVVGRGPGELEGERVETLLTPPARVFLHTHVMPTLRAIGSIDEVYLDLRAAAGASVPTLWNAIVCGEVGARITDVAVMVVRQRAQFERALVAARKAAEDARRDEARAVAEVVQLRKLESLATLAGGVAHDFNNLLCAIAGNVELMRGALPAAHPASEWLADTEQATRRATELAAKMLSYSGRARFAFAPVALDALLERRAAELTARAPEGVGLAVDVGPGVTVDGDARQLELLVGSLVENAFEATAPGGEPVAVRLRAEQLDEAALGRFHVGGKAAPGRYAVLAVVDRGCGMAAAARDQLFEPFCSTKGAGRGLGLATSLGVVRAHRGAIRVESAVGLGTTVTVALPVRPERATGVVSVAPPPRGAKVLVVDADRAVRTMLSRGLGRMGFEVLTAARADEGRDVLLAHPDLACAVVDASSLPGLDALAVLREQRRALPALVVGAAPDDAAFAALAAANPGETRPFSKPYTVLALGQALGELVARAPPAAE